MPIFKNQRAEEKFNDDPFIFLRFKSEVSINVGSFFTSLRPQTNDGGNREKQIDEK